jgi:tyrosine-protein phosphatase YwqE
MLFPFLCKRTSLRSAGIFNGFTDWHSHILPGVDDGVPTMEEALQILHLYDELGVKAVWLTPHIMEDIPNTTAHLKERFAALQTAYTGNVTLRLAAEHMLDNLFERRLAAGDVLPIGERGDHLLVETSYFSPPMNLHRTLERIKSKGYYPILAHPERYAYMSRKEYQQLKEMGVRFQLNLPSIVGMYGKDAAHTAAWLLKHNFYHFIGSDVHRFSVWERVMNDKRVNANMMKPYSEYR